MILGRDGGRSVSPPRAPQNNRTGRRDIPGSDKGGCAVVTLALLAAPVVAFVAMFGHWLYS